MENLIRKIQIHLETTEECIQNTVLPEYVVELLEADNKLFAEVVTKYQQESSEKDIDDAYNKGFKDAMIKYTMIKYKTI